MISFRSFATHALAIMFGISSWIEISGVGVEMPLMVQILPEGWALGSYVVVITQIGNVGPLVYSLLRKYISREVIEIPTIHVILFIAGLTCLLLSQFWDVTTMIAGESHSTAFLILVGCLALVDCTSSVLYLPYMATFREIYVISCMIGEAACGFIPSIAGFAQGVSDKYQCINGTKKAIGPEPKFSVSSYFVFLFSMVAVSWIAFVLLDKLPALRREKVSNERHSDDTVEENERNQLCLIGSNNIEDESSAPSKYISLLAIQTYICFIQNGVLSSIQAYSCMPYGSLTYQLSVNLLLIANPLGCVVALFRPMRTTYSVTLLTIASSVFASYILAIALESPTPPLQHSIMGPILIVTSWVVFTFALSHIKASVAAILRRKGGNRALFWGGAMSQVGSCVGGVFMFIIVRYTTLFKSDEPC